MPWRSAPEPAVTELPSASLNADSTSFVNQAPQQGVEVSPEVRRATRLRLVIPLRLTSWPGSPSAGVMVLAFPDELRLHSRCSSADVPYVLCKKYLTRLRLSKTSNCPSEGDWGLGNAVSSTLHRAKPGSLQPRELAEILELSVRSGNVECKPKSKLCTHKAL